MDFHVQYYASKAWAFDFDYVKNRNFTCSNEEFPPTMMSETKDYYYLRMLIPGLGLEDFKLSMKENKLLFEGRFSHIEGKYLLKERACGRFKRLYTFDSCIEKENVISELKDGLLTLKLQKEKSERIDIITTDKADTETGKEI